MKTLRIILIAISCIFIQYGQAQLKQEKATDPPVNQSKLVGYHFGFVNVFCSVKDGDLRWHDRYDLYSIGFPMGLTLRTPVKLLVDLEAVPFIQPYLASDEPFQVHLLWHPGVLLPLSKGWTLGLRAAFETGVGQFGFTPLINKAFKISEQTSLFLELVLPARFGPAKDNGYIQLAGLHAGVGF
jgi:hypothetical protein